MPNVIAINAQASQSIIAAQATSDDMLLESIADGNRTSMHILYCRHSVRVYRFILRIVRDELTQIIRLTAEPLFTRVFRWRGAMAQYGVGHLERLQRIEALRRQHSGLALAGNGYNGIGVPDCVRSGTEAVRTVLQALGVAEPQSLSTP